MSRQTTFNATQVRQLLNSGLSDIGLTVSEKQLTQLVDYLALMVKWNGVYNLSAIREIDKMVSHHLLDSLVVVDIFEKLLTDYNQPKLLDVGTGGGLPGIVLAIMQPTWQVTLIDPVHKKTAFLSQVKAQLALTNLSVVTGKVEALSPAQPFDLITSRAFASITDFVRLSENVLQPDGIFAAMKGVLPTDELNELSQFAPDQWASETLSLTVPQLNAQRHLIKLWRI